ncbi:MAG: PTS sugar transporter subunit IIA [Kangiellaceae bacterium]|nr:PTS sugar transporter subunit IIA [Kangiellaceae bacterium]
MNISQLLSPDATLVCNDISSKKKMLEKVSEIIALNIDTKPKIIFESLLTREKLGTTALGDGVAIPHGRVASCEQVTAVFILLETPIDYDAADGKKVDIVFAIMVPEEAHAEHLKHLAHIAEILSNQKILSQIRHAHCSEALYEILETAAEKLDI